jgi:hypothetical protein
MPLELCGFCLIGEHVPAFRSSANRWEIGEVISFYESVLPYQFLLKFGFEGDDTEWVIVAMDPFADYAHHCRVIGKGNDKKDGIMALPTHITRPISSPLHKSKNESLSKLKFREVYSPATETQKLDLQCSDILDGSNVGENGIKSRRLWTEEVSSKSCNTQKILKILTIFCHFERKMPYYLALLVHVLISLIGTKFQISCRILQLCNVAIGIQ